MFNFTHFNNMKNFIIIIYTIIATSSCVSDNNIPDNTIEKIYINKEKVFPNMNGNIDIRIVNFNYKNHQYLYFLSHCTNESSCVIHDPDCPCHKK